MIWPYIFLAYLSLFVFGITDNLRGPLFPEILKEFHVSDSMGSMMFALSNISGFVASYLARYLLRRFDRRKVLQSAALVMIAALMGLAFAPNFYFFLFSSFVFGLCLGIIGLIPNILVPMGSNQERKQQLLAGLHSMYGVASLLSPLLAASVVSMTGNWRWAFACVSIAPLTLFFYCMHSSHKKLHPKKTLEERSQKLAHNPHFKAQMYLALMVSFCVAAEIMVSSRLALFIRRTVVDDIEKASMYVSLFFIFMLAGRALFTLVKFKFSIRVLLTNALITSFISTLLGIYVHPFFLSLVGFTVAPFYPLSIAWISNKFPHNLDTAVSYMIGTDSVMLVLMHLGMGYLTDVLGIEKALLMGPVCLLISLFFVSTYERFFEQKTTVSKDTLPHASETTGAIVNPQEPQY